MDYEKLTEANRLKASIKDARKSLKILQWATSENVAARESPIIFRTSNRTEESVYVVLSKSEFKIVFGFLYSKTKAKLLKLENEFKDL